MRVYNKDKCNKDVKFILQKAAVLLAKNFAREKSFCEGISIILSLVK